MTITCVIAESNLVIGTKGKWLFEMCYQLLKYFCVALVVVAIMLPTALTPTANAQASATVVPHYKNRLPGVLLTEMWDWTAETWTGDDAPYHQARAAVDQTAVSTQKLDALREVYKTEWMEKRTDSLAAFKWAYSAYLVMQTRKSTYTQYKALNGVEEALRNADSPHTYDYSRVRFLVSTFYTPDRHLALVGERLLARDKTDYMVGYNLAGVYLEDYAPAKTEKALSICQHLEQLYPTKSSLYALIGEAYVLRWYENKNPSDAEAVIANYQKYLQMAPANEEFRVAAQGIIKTFNKNLKQE